MSNVNRLVLVHLIAEAFFHKSHSCYVIMHFYSKSPSIFLLQATTLEWWVVGRSIETSYTVWHWHLRLAGKSRFFFQWCFQLFKTCSICLPMETHPLTHTKCSVYDNKSNCSATAVTDQINLIQINVNILYSGKHTSCGSDFYIYK